MGVLDKNYSCLVMAVAKSYLPSYFYIVVCHLISFATLCFFLAQIRVRLFDDAFPDNVLEDMLTVLVRRNVNAPSFTNKLVNLSIPDTSLSGNSIHSLSASDPDMVFGFP